jgi:hypothetical protein
MTTGLSDRRLGNGADNVMLDLFFLLHACILVVIASDRQKSNHLFFDNLFIIHDIPTLQSFRSRVEKILCILHAHCYPSAEGAGPRTLARAHTTSVPDHARSARGRSCGAGRSPTSYGPSSLSLIARTTFERAAACASTAPGAAAGQHTAARRSKRAAGAPARPPRRRGNVCGLHERAVRGRVRVSVVDGFHLAFAPRSPMSASPTAAVPIAPSSPSIWVRCPRVPSCRQHSISKILRTGLHERR